jgi:hypothetical protein
MLNRCHVAQTVRQRSKIGYDLAFLSMCKPTNNQTKSSVVNDTLSERIGPSATLAASSLAKLNTSFSVSSIVDGVTELDASRLRSNLSRAAI